jgi:hypothetical protein
LADILDRWPAPLIGHYRIKKFKNR